MSIDGVSGRTSYIGTSILNIRKQLADGQDVVLNTLKQKVTATSGVNIDDEMAHLLALQNAYSANARVMSSIKQMYDLLIQSM